MGAFTCRDLHNFHYHKTLTACVALSPQPAGTPMPLPGHPALGHWLPGVFCLLIPHRAWSGFVLRPPRDQKTSAPAAYQQQQWKCQPVNEMIATNLLSPYLRRQLAKKKKKKEQQQTHTNLHATLKVFFIVLKDICTVFSTKVCGRRIKTPSTCV